MKPIINIRIPYPKIGSGRAKQSLYTMNNITRLHWSQISKIKNTLKSNLKEWYFTPNQGEPYKALVLEFTAIRHNRRKLDALNMSTCAKVIEDVLTDLGYVEDDDRNTIILHPSRYEEGLVETMLQITVKEAEDEKKSGE